MAAPAMPRYPPREVDDKAVSVTRVLSKVTCILGAAAVAGACSIVAPASSWAAPLAAKPRAGSTATPSLGGVSLTQLPAAGGSTHELSLAPHSIWITQPKADRVLRATVHNGVVRGIQQFPLPDGSMPHGIEAISDTGAWVTLEGSDQIVRINDKGQVSTRIALPAGTGPHGLVLTRDHKLWYAGKEGSVIGEADPRTAQVVRTIPLPAGSAPIYVTEGSDGAIWWTELLGSSVGRVDRRGVTRIALPNSQPGAGSARPIAITADHDGTIWFSEEAGNAIGRIPAAVATGAPSALTTSAISITPMPTAGSKPAGLALGPDRTVWVQTTNPYTVVRIHTGHVTAYSLPQLAIAPPATAPLPHRIQPSPDGTLWYTDLNGDWLGHIHLT